MSIKHIMAWLARMNRRASYLTGAIWFIISIGIVGAGVETGNKVLQVLGTILFFSYFALGVFSEDYEKDGRRADGTTDAGTPDDGYEKKDTDSSSAV